MASPGSIPVLVTLPCDLTQWPVIKEILLESAQSTDTDQLVTNLGRAYSLVHKSNFQVDPKAKKARKSKNIFQGLKSYLDNQVGDIEKNVFFNVILPCIIQRAVNIEILKPEDGLQFVRQNEAKTVVLSRRMVSSIVACGVLALYPGRAYSKHSSLCGINYDEFYNHLSNVSQRAKLACIFQYFENIAGNPDGPEGDIIFARKVLDDENQLVFDEWIDCNLPLCTVDVFYPPEKIEDSGHSVIQVDFANRKVGGAVLAKGAVQEEIRFCTCPELQASMLFMEEMMDHEAIVIQGFENFSKYKGYSRNLQYDGIYEDTAARNELGNLENTLCAIDAMPARRIGGAKEQYKSVNVLRELNKSFAGFSLAQSVVEMESYAGCHCESVKTPKLQKYTTHVAHHHNKRAIHTKHVREKKKGSDTLHFSAYNSGLVENILHDALDKTASVPADKRAVSSAEEREVPGKDDTTECRHNPVCDERRRSSNMSNLSSSSASGKRSSSEFSSEFEEYFEAFQQRERKTKHVVIQEEASGPGECEGGVQTFSDPSKLSDSLLKNITKPAVVRPNLNSSQAPTGGVHRQTCSKSTANSENVPRHVTVASDLVDDIFTSVVSESDGRAYPTPEDMNVGLMDYAHDTGNAIIGRVVDEASKSASFTGQQTGTSNNDIPSPEGKITASLYIAISRMAENMVNEGFKVVKETLLAESEPKEPDVDVPYVCPLLLEKIENMADKLVSNALKSAVTIGASHLATRRKANRAKWGGHYGVTRELYLFADNFVQEIMHEALCFAREQTDGMPGRRDRTNEDAWLKPPERERANSIYFQAEFSSGLRSSNPNLRRRDSVGSFRRGSYDERLGRRRASSSGFRDSVLSDFEDELILSNVSSPGLHMLGFQGDNEINTQKRRASEPANCTDAEFGFSRSYRNSLCSPLKKRACSVDCSSSRQVVLDWLSRQSSSSQTSLHQRQHLRKRTHTTSSHLDWFAQDLLVDAFNDAFVELFGGSYYTTPAASSLSSAVSSQSELNRSRTGSVSGMPAIARFASSLAKTVLNEACSSATKGKVSRQSPENALPLGACHAELEAAADKLARKVMIEAIEIAKSEWAAYCPPPSSPNKRPIATGNWGCGAYKGDPQLKAMIQWAAASRAQSPAMWYYTFGNDEVKPLSKVCHAVLAKGLSAGSLMKLVNQYSQKRCSKKVQGTLFDFLQEKVTK